MKPFCETSRIRTKSGTPFAGLPYAELCCKTNFSFLRGASHPEELARRAAELGYTALAVTDRNTLAGVVRMHCAAKACNLELIIGAELTPVDAPPITLYAPNRAAYGRLARIITQGRLRAAKGSCKVTLDDITQWSDGLIAVVHNVGRSIFSEPRDVGRALPAVGYPAPSKPRAPASEPPPFSEPRAPARGNRHSAASSGPSVPPYQGGKEGGCFQGGMAKSRRAGTAGGCRHVVEDPSTMPILRLGMPSNQPVARAPGSDSHHRTPIRTYRDIFGDRLYLVVNVHGGPDDDQHLAEMDALAKATGVPMVATNDVYYHEPQRRFLQDVLTCIREHCTLEEAGRKLFANAERHLKPIEEMARLFADYPDAIARTCEIADRCTFSLDELRYEYPEAICPKDQSSSESLAELTWAGARQRYPDGIPDKVRTLIEHELKLIRELEYEPYFLTVHDIVQFARSRDILCQGRGSAANSAVCYCLDITAVDPNRIDLLFERFVSAERNEPPDIDVDFEHERREEVFQYIYDKYGRDHAGIVAEAITYRPRSAIRDVGKVLGLSLDRVGALAQKHEWWDKETLREDAAREVGLDPRDRSVRMLGRLVNQLLGFPRHLSQHVGGFVITRGPLCEMVPIENGAMPDRTFIEWDKDDIDALGILKIDCLALGMLTAIHKCFVMINENEKPQGDKGTEGRRDEGTKGWNRTTSIIRRNADANKDVSGSDRVAKGHGTDQTDLSCHRSDAEQRKVRTDGTDASSGGLDPLKHRRRARPRKSNGLHPLPTNRPRLVDGVADPTHPGRTTEPHPRPGKTQRPAKGNRSRPARPDPQPRKPPELTPPPLPSSLCSSVPSSLPSVASSLRPFVPLVPLTLDNIPPEDPVVYDMICHADTVGVFQIESRAQMSMLPRLRPRRYYDLVIEVAIVRPGPIQGGMVHPYLRRRNGEEAITYPNEAIKEVLQKTLGVPLFQEQAMRLAVVAAGFTPGEADQLRRAMGAWRRHGVIDRFHTRLIEGMRANGLPEEFAERCFKQISGFGEYGFPESHAASFALLVYVSAWLKRYHPAAFCAAIINSQPMGFYHPAQLVRDAREHGVTVLPIDVNYSNYDCRLEEHRQPSAISRQPSAVSDQQPSIPNPQSAIRNPQSLSRRLQPARRSARVKTRGSPSLEPPQFWGINGPAVRLGIRLIKGISRAQVEGIERARRERPFTSVADLAYRSGATRSTLARLAAADALRSLQVGSAVARSRLPIEDRDVGARTKPPSESYVGSTVRTKAPANGCPTPSGGGGRTDHNPPLNRREALWQVLALGDEPPMLEDTEPVEANPKLPEMSLEETVYADYETIGLSLNAHPMSLIREELKPLRISQSRDLRQAKQGQWIRVAGLVLVRQRPSTALGIVFCTLEDETGTANLVIRPQIFEKYRRAAHAAVALVAEGRVERQGEVVHLQTTRLEDLSHALANLRSQSRDFH